KDLIQHWSNGQIKLYLTYTALQFRRNHRELFLSGDYLPIAPSGPQAEHLFGFARRQGSSWALIVVPRCVAGLVEAGSLMPAPSVWEETTVPLFPAAPARW